MPGLPERVRTQVAEAAKASGTLRESSVRAAIRHYLTSIENLVYFPMPGGPFSRRGAPDFVLCYNSAFVAIEVKSPTGKQTPVQQVTQRATEACGGTYILARSAQDVRDWFERGDDT